jgi:deoxyribose-phosphate aldolase
MENIANYIDHTLLKPDSEYGRYTELCREAQEYGFHSVCVNPFYVPLVTSLLKEGNLKGIKVCAVNGFPFGAHSTITKVLEASDAISNGATEIDTVINIGALKSNNLGRLKSELWALRDITRNRELKVILEVGLLTETEVKRACELCIETHCDFVKTSTGFNIKNTAEDTIRHSKLLLDCVKGTEVKVKASSGIKELQGEKI